MIVRSTYLSAMLNIRPSRRHSIYHLDVVLKQQFRQDQLDLVVCKKPPGTRVSPIAESKILVVNINKMIARANLI